MQEGAERRCGNVRFDKIDARLADSQPRIMPSPNALVLRFIRKNGLSQSDDIATIEKLGVNQYSLQYTYGLSSNKKPFRIVLNDRKLFWWVRVLLRLLKKDTDPFESVQIDLPILPSVLINVQAMDGSYHTILDAIEFHLDNWPSNEGQEDEYEDLPALLPITPPTTTSENRFASAYGRAYVRAFGHSLDSSFDRPFDQTMSVD